LRLLQECKYTRGILRKEDWLEEAVKGIEELKDNRIPKLSARNKRELCNVIEAKAMTELGEMITKSAQLREDTRGAHYRLDNPRPDDQNWLVNIFMHKEGDEISFEMKPVVITRIKPSPRSELNIVQEGYDA